MKRATVKAGLTLPDGTGIILAARLLGYPHFGRLDGPTLMLYACDIGRKYSYRHFFYGGVGNVAVRNCERLSKLYPGLKVAGCQHGYFAEEKNREVVEAIKAAKPAVLFVAMGIPRQEKWIKRHLQELGVPVCMGVGGSFDVIAGRVKRAPEWMRCYGLEWLYRTLKQPRRLPRLAALPRMFLMTVHTLLLSPERPDNGEVEPDLPAEHEC